MLLLLFPFTQEGNTFWIQVTAQAGLFVLAALGLNIVVGLAGLLDLGYVAFFGIGAYTAAITGNALLTNELPHPVHPGHVHRRPRGKGLLRGPPGCPHPAPAR